jgi:NAD(P)-dependent dehydrogenase (short-subunit alcohol dehydrogenase family)
MTDLASAALRLDGRIALVTVAGRRLGAGTAALLAAQGARVVVADMDAPSTEAVVSSIGPAAVSRVLGVRDARASFTEAIEATVCELGSLDILVTTPRRRSADRSFSAVRSAAPPCATRSAGASSSKAPIRSGSRGEC